MRCGPALFFRFLYLVTILQNTSSTISSKWSPCLAAARVLAEICFANVCGSNTPPACYSLPSRRFATLRGRLREEQHFEEDPNATRCPTGSTSLRSAQDDRLYQASLREGGGPRREVPERECNERLGFARSGGRSPTRVKNYRML